MNTQQAALVTLLRTLNHQTPKSDLEQLALSLQISATLGAVGDLPRARDAGGKTARCELDTVARKAADLGRLMLALHSDAIRAFEKVESDGEVHPLMVGPLLKHFADCAKQASGKVSDAPPHRGNRQRVQPRVVAHRARAIYEQLTGRKAGRTTDAYRNGQSSGAFHTFLSEIYSMFKIQTSADSQIKLLQSSPHGKNTRKQIV